MKILKDFRRIFLVKQAAISSLFWSFFSEKNKLMTVSLLKLKKGK